MKLEKKIQQFESLVQALESEEIDFDKATEQYQKAILLAKELMGLLQKTESNLIQLQEDFKQVNQ